MVLFYLNISESHSIIKFVSIEGLLVSVCACRLMHSFKFIEKFYFFFWIMHTLKSFETKGFGVYILTISFFSTNNTHRPMNKLLKLCCSKHILQIRKDTCFLSSSASFSSSSLLYTTGKSERLHGNGLV